MRACNRRFVARRFVLWTALCALALAPSARAQPGRPAPRPDVPASKLPEPLREVAFEQRLGDVVPLDLEFLDEDGKRVRLRDCVRGRPVILSLVYYECPMLCTMVLNGLASCLEVLQFDVGREFEVLTVSFDPTETPDLARKKKASYLKRYGRPEAGEGWHFLTGEEAAIRSLTESVGFRYVYDTDRGEYAHASGIVLLTPEGRIARYFYGVEYPPKDVRLGLVEAADGKIGSFVDQVLLYCFHYDPATGKYGAAVMRLVRLGGVLTVLALGVFFWAGRRKSRKAAIHHV